MSRKRTKLNIDSKVKIEMDNSSGTNGPDDLIETEKIVGIHILGKLDMQRHFGTSDFNAHGSGRKGGDRKEDN